MVEGVETLMADLRSKVFSLEKDVGDLSSMSTTSSEYDLKAKTVAELITQALENVDSMQISKDAAVEALRTGEREKSRKLAVLLARRKTMVKRLTSLGDEVDKLKEKKAGEQLSVQAALGELSTDGAEIVPTEEVQEQSCAEQALQ